MIKFDKNKEKGDNMRDRFEKLRCKLHKIIEEYGINSNEVKKISERFDELVNSYYKIEIQYSRNSIMYIKYLESLEILKKITRDFSKYPTIEE